MKIIKQNLDVALSIHTQKITTYKHTHTQFYGIVICIQSKQNENWKVKRRKKVTAEGKKKIMKP